MLCMNQVWPEKLGLKVMVRVHYPPKYKGKRWEHPEKEMENLMKPRINPKGKWSESHCYIPLPEQTNPNRALEGRAIKIYTFRLKVVTTLVTLGVNCLRQGLKSPHLQNDRSEFPDKLINLILTVTFQLNNNAMTTVPAIIYRGPVSSGILLGNLKT